MTNQNVFSLQLQPVTRMERLSVESFLDAGYNYTLYAYDADRRFGVIPLPAEYADANQILPQSLCVPDRDGSYRTFTALFQFAALYKHGGLWADTDYVILRQLPEQDHLAIRDDDGTLLPYLLRLPRESALAQVGMVWANERLSKAGHDNRCTIMENLVFGWPQKPEDAIQIPVANGCPVRETDFNAVIEPMGLVLDEKAYGYKLWRSRWDCPDCTPDSKFSPDTIIEQLWQRYIGTNKCPGET